VPHPEHMPVRDRELGCGAHQELHGGSDPDLWHAERDAMQPGQRANGAASRMTVATLSRKAWPAGVIGAASVVGLKAALRW
jgi:hypothetical protein